MIRGVYSNIETFCLGVTVAKVWLVSGIRYMFMCIYNMLNKNTLGVKKVRGQSEAALQTGVTKNFDIS